jgi:hypothetical protein
MSVAAKGHKEVFQLKQNEGLYPKDHIEKGLEDDPGGDKAVLSGIAPNDIPRFALGFHYSKKPTLLFVMT